MALSKKVNIKYSVDARGAKRGLDSLEKSTSAVRKKTDETTLTLREMGNAARLSRLRIAELKRGVDDSRRALDQMRGSRNGGGLTGFAKEADRVGDGLRNTVDAFNAVRDGFRAVSTSALQSQVALANLPFTIDQARGATRGWVDDLTLQQQALAASQFGVAKTSEKFAQLANAATKLGIAAGRDATTSIQELTNALARGEKEILDNLNVLLTQEEANREYAKQIGKVASELTEAERKQAFMTIGLERATEAANKINIELDQSAEFIQTWDATLNNAANTASKVFVKALSVTSQALEGVLLEVTGVNDEITRLNQLNGGVTTQRGLGGRGGAAEQEAKRVAREAEEERDRKLRFNKNDLDVKKNTVKILEVELAKVEGITAQAGRQRALKQAIAETELEILGLEGERAKLQGDLATSFEKQLEARLAQAKAENEVDKAKQGGDRYGRQRLIFQQQLTEAINAERKREFSNAVTLQRGYLSDVRRFEEELSQVRRVETDRLSLTNAELERKAQLDLANLQRQQEMAQVNGDPEAVFAREMEMFAIREEALQRQLDLETQVGEREALTDQLAQVRHEREIARIEREQSVRTEATRRQEAETRSRLQLVGEISNAERASFQLVEAVGEAAIKGSERRRKVMVGIKTTELAIDGGISIARGAIEIAAGNYVGGAAQIAAGTAAIVKAGTLAASVGANAGGGGGGGGSTAGTATQFSRGESPQRAEFNVDRGAPISVRDSEIQNNPNNTGSSGRGGPARTVNNNSIQVLGAIDDDSALKIARGIKRAEASLGR